MNDEGRPLAPPPPPAGEVVIHVSLEGVDQGQPRLFAFERGGEQLTGIVLRHDNRFHAYVNRCPHVGYSLDFGDGQVMDRSQKFLYCQAHGAMFLPESGQCFMGPPVDRFLERLPMRVQGLVAHVTIPTVSEDGVDSDDWD